MRPRGEAQVDVAHEALIRAWPRLRQWLDEDRQGLLVHRRLTEAAQEWQRSGRDPDLLFRGTRLAEVLALAALQPDTLNELEQAFLAESQAGRERERAEVAAAAAARERMRRRILAGLGVFSAVALLLALLAGLQWREAGLQATEARVQTGRAEQQAAAAANAEATAQSEASRAEREAGVARTAEDEAQHQAAAARQAETTSLARFLAAQSQSPAIKLDESMLLAAEAYDLLPDDLEERRALFSATYAHPDLERMVYGNTNRVVSLAFSPDETVLAAGEVGGRILRWDPATGQPTGKPFATGETNVTSLVFRPNETKGQSLPHWQLATGSESGVIQIWDLGVEPPVARLRLQGGSEINALAFTADGTRLAAATARGEITIWNAETGDVVTPTWQAHDGGIESLDFNPHDTLLVSGGFDDGVVTGWDPTSGKPRGEFLRNYGRVAAIKFTPDGQTLAISAGGQVFFWDTVNYVPLRTLDLGEEVGDAAVGIELAMSADGKILAAADTEGTIRQWQIDTGAPLGSPIVSGQRPVYGMALNSDGSLLATGGAESDVRLWSTDTQPPRLFQTPNGHLSFPQALAFSPDNVTIATGDEDGAVFLWDSQNGDPIGERLRTQAEAIWALAFNHDGSLLASASEDGTVQLWDPRTGLAASPLLGGHELEPVQALAFSPAGNWLATGGSNSAVRLWHLTDGGVEVGPETKSGDTGFILTLAFNDTGTILAGGDGTSQLLLWRVDDSLTRLWKVDTQQGGLASLCFIEKDVIATGGGDGSIHFWNIVDEAEVNEPIDAHGDVVFTLSCDPTRG